MKIKQICLVIMIPEISNTPNYVE